MQRRREDEFEDNEEEDSSSSSNTIVSEKSSHEFVEKLNNKTESNYYMENQRNISQNEGNLPQYKTSSEESLRREEYLENQRIKLETKLQMLFKAEKAIFNQTMSSQQSAPFFQRPSTNDQNDKTENQPSPNIQSPQLRSIYGSPDRQSFVTLKTNEVNPDYFKRKEEYNSQNSQIDIRNSKEFITKKDQSIAKNYNSHFSNNMNTNSGHSNHNNNNNYPHQNNSFNAISNSFQQAGGVLDSKRKLKQSNINKQSILSPNNVTRETEGNYRTNPTFGTNINNFTNNQQSNVKMGQRSPSQIQYLKSQLKHYENQTSPVLNQEEILQEKYFSSNPNNERLLYQEKAHGGQDYHQQTGRNGGNNLQKPNAVFNNLNQNGNMNYRDIMPFPPKYNNIYSAINDRFPLNQNQSAQSNYNNYFPNSNNSHHHTAQVFNDSREELRNQKHFHSFNNYQMPQQRQLRENCQEVVIESQPKSRGSQKREQDVREIKKQVNELTDKLVKSGIVQNHSFTQDKENNSRFNETQNQPSANNYNRNNQTFGSKVPLQEQEERSKSQENKGKVTAHFQKSNSTNLCKSKKLDINNSAHPQNLPLAPKCQNTLLKDEEEFQAQKEINTEKVEHMKKHIEQMAGKINALYKDNFDLNERNKWLQFQLKNSNQKKEIKIVNHDINNQIQYLQKSRNQIKDEFLRWKGRLRSLLGDYTQQIQDLQVEMFGLKADFSKIVRENAKYVSILQKQFRKDQHS